MTDLFLGRSSVFQQNAFTGTQNRLDYIGLYAQDSWKATPRLTVNYGMRWDPYFPVAKKHDYMAHLDIAWMLSGVTTRIILRPSMMCEGIGRSLVSPGLTSSPVVSRIGIALLPFLIRNLPSSRGSSER